MPKSEQVGASESEVELSDLEIMRKEICGKCIVICSGLDTVSVLRVILVQIFNKVESSVCCKL